MTPREKNLTLFWISREENDKISSKKFGLNNNSPLFNQFATKRAQSNQFAMKRAQSNQFATKRAQSNQFATKRAQSNQFATKRAQSNQFATKRTHKAFFWKGIPCSTCFTPLLWFRNHQSKPRKGIGGFRGLRFLNFAFSVKGFRNHHILELLNTKRKYFSRTDTRMF